MLVLTRKIRQQIHIGENITITILRVKGQAVRVGIEAPGDVRILRGEITLAEDATATESQATVSDDHVADGNDSSGRRVTDGAESKAGSSVTSDATGAEAGRRGSQSTCGRIDLPRAPRMPSDRPASSQLLTMVARRRRRAPLLSF